VRYPEVHLVFADSRRFAEEWTYLPHHSARRRVRPEPERLRHLEAVDGTGDLSGTGAKTNFRPLHGTEPKLHGRLPPPNHPLEQAFPHRPNRLRPAIAGWHLIEPV